MELCFFCPVRRKLFHSARWSAEGCLEVVEDRSGQRRLRGKVRVECPLCGGEHAYDPDELACPLSRNEDDGQGDCNTEGGERWRAE